MPRTITRDRLKAMMDRNEDFALIEVLEPEKFEEFHLPGAINIPNDDNFEQQVRDTVSDQSKAIVVYCWDKDCSASPDAASKLESIGYRKVFDYEEGKKAWKDAGLPVESGSAVGAPR